MVIANERFSVGVLNSFELEPAPTPKLAAIGNGLVDRRELQKVVLAFARASEQ